MSKRLFRRFFTQSSDQPMSEGDAASESIRRLLRSCPRCEAALDQEHQFAKVATAIVRNQSDLLAGEFVTLAKQHLWERLRSFQEWDPTLDVLGCDVIVCPYGLPTMILSVWPVELYSANKVIFSEGLNVEASQSLNAIPSLGWRSF